MSNMRFYGQVNSDGICIAVSQLSGVVDRDDLIPLAVMNENVLRRKRYRKQWRELNGKGSMKAISAKNRIDELNIG